MKRFVTPQTQRTTLCLTTWNKPNELSKTVTNQRRRVRVAAESTPFDFAPMATPNPVTKTPNRESSLLEIGIELPSTKRVPSSPSTTPRIKLLTDFRNSESNWNGPTNGTSATPAAKHIAASQIAILGDATASTMVAEQRSAVRAWRKSQPSICDVWKAEATPA